MDRIIFELPYYHKWNGILRGIKRDETLSPERFFTKSFKAIPRGRDGITAILEHLRLKPDDEVYISTSSSSPFVSSCVTSTIFNYCKPSRVVTEKTRLMFIIHEFGVPDPKTKAIVELAREKGIPVVEDCAHTFDSKIDGKLVGNFGDYAIYSLSKVFPMKGGGVITGDNLDFVPFLSSEENIEQELRYYLPMLPTFTKRKQAMFEYLATSLEPLFTINENVSPYRFPLVVNGDASALHNELGTRGIECGLWYGRNVVTLPIHPLLTKKDLEIIKEEVKNGKQNFTSG